VLGLQFLREMKVYSPRMDPNDPTLTGFPSHIKKKINKRPLTMWKLIHQTGLRYIPFEGMRLKLKKLTFNLNT
jgi:hypothetical protein